MWQTNCIVKKYWTWHQLHVVNKTLPITTKNIARNIQKTEKLLKLVGPNSNCMVKTKHWLKKKLKTIAKLHCQNILDLTDIARCKKTLPAHRETKQRYHRKHWLISIFLENFIRRGKIWMLKERLHRKMDGNLVQSWWCNSAVDRVVRTSKFQTAKPYALFVLVLV